MYTIGPSADPVSGPIYSVLDALTVAGHAIDVGSGVGRIVHRLRALGWDVEGVELDAEAARTAGVDQGDVLTWEPSERAMLITCVELIEHLPADDQPRLLARLREWLQPGGRVVLSTPQRHSPVALLEQVVCRVRPSLGPYGWWDPTHISVLPRRRLERLLAEAGFEIIDRVGIHFAPDFLPIPRLHRTPIRGLMSRLGWDLVYVLATRQTA